MRVGIEAMIIGVATVVCLVGTGCRDLTQAIPDGTIDPAVFRTPEGAIKLYNGVKVMMPAVQSSKVDATGQLTDELQNFQAADVTFLFGKVPQLTDARNAADSTLDIVNFYRSLHDARNHIDQAISMLKLFPDKTPKKYRGELFALKGIVLTSFSEAFCSGIPLSQVDFDADFTYAPGISRDSLLRVALSNYDSAEAYADGDSVVQQMIAAGRARVWLQTDSVRLAASYAKQVRTGFNYTVPRMLFVRPSYRVSDREGINGLSYRSSGDPRTAVTVAQIKTTDGVVDTTFYLKQIAAATTPVSLMSYIEAALIVAEGTLVAGESDWIDQLNALRTSGTFTISGTDTLWNAGAGGVAGLRPLTDPGLDSLPPGKTVFDVRLDLLMRERAYWLFLTGTRLGDLRRLVRHYGRDAEEVYPTGPYGRNGFQFNVRYGNDVVLPVPKREQDLNPLYHGCFDVGA